MQVVALALETWIRQDGHAQVKVARQPSSTAGSSLAGHAHLCTGLGPRWYLDFQTLAVLFEHAGCAVIGFLQRDLDRLLKVLAALGPGLVLKAAATRVATHTTKDLAEKVREGAVAAKHILQVFRRAVAHVHAPTWSSAGPLTPIKVPGPAAMSAASAASRRPIGRTFGASLGRTALRRLR